MWRIERTGTPTARAWGEPGDESTTLADAVGLQADEADAWLGADSEPLSAQVPNTVVFLWAGDLGGLGRLAVRWPDEIAYTRRLGFHVIDIDFRRGAEGVLELLCDSSAHGELHGLVITGHGSPAYVGTGGLTARFHKGWSLAYEEIAACLRYRLALVVLNACLSGYSRNDETIRTARSFMHSRIDPDYELSVGGRDLVATSPMARFYGCGKILYPVLEGGRVRRLLRPGDQGTA